MADVQMSSNSEPLFRPTKRRRQYRQRSRQAEDAEMRAASLLVSRDDQPDGGAPDQEPSQRPSFHQDDEETSRPMAEILRLRRNARGRRGGIEFVDGDTQAARTADAIEAVVGREGTSGEIAAIVNRFAPQTGQVADVNQHMMAYIDSELARLHHGDAEHAGSGSGVISSGDVRAGRSRPGQLPRQPATLGKLHEVDLGPGNKIRNIERTEAAKRRVEGVREDDLADGDVPPKLRKDGKPWRNRKRRTSDDIERDKLVEEVLRESKIELYDEPDPGVNVDDTQAADDRIAEQFRRDFLDAISSRHRRRFGARSAAAKAARKDDRPRGPKLGGSRSARAAMREQQQQERAKR